MEQAPTIERSDQALFPGYDKTGSRRSEFGAKGRRTHGASRPTDHHRSAQGSNGHVDSHRR